MRGWEIEAMVRKSTVRYSDSLRLACFIGPNLLAALETLCAAVVMCARLANGGDVVADPHLPGEVNYVTQDAADFRPPQYPGEYYEAKVPATLDLAERGRLAINALTGMLNPNCDDELYTAVYHMTDPPVMVHSDSDLNTMGKYLEAIPLVRSTCGSQQNLDVERGLMRTFLKMQGDDGLIYLPVKGRPWTLPPTRQANSGMPGIHDGVDQVGLLGYGNVRALAAFLVYAQKDPDGPWRDAARKLVDGLKRTVVEDGDIAYTFSSWSTPGRAIQKPDKPPTGILGGMVAWLAQYLVIYDRAVGDPDATRLAQKMLHYTFGDMKYFGEDGRFLNDGVDVGAGRDEGHCAHFHTHAMNILAALYVVDRTHDAWLLDRARRAYEWASSRQSESEPLVGYFPEVTSDFVGEREQTKTSETCEVADMIQSAMMLSHLGIDKWDDADRWIRNQLAENQLTGTSWRTDGHIVLTDFAPLPPLPLGQYTTDRVLERTVGSFSGWASMNDWVGRPKRRVTIMNCCSGSGARVLYAAWKNMISFDEVKQSLKVHLLLNRASPWADIDSCIPFTGQVDVHLKRDLDLSVRIPEWVEPDDVRCRVESEDRELEFDGRYAQVGHVAAGQKVTVTFPIAERTDHVMVLGEPYTLTRKGNEVVAIDPPGNYCPLYQRANYRNDKPEFRQLTRFVSSEQFPWW
jgi:hypothetical protein